MLDFGAVVSGLLHTLSWLSNDHGSRELHAHEHHFTYMEVSLPIQILRQNFTEHSDIKQIAVDSIFLKREIKK